MEPGNIIDKYIVSVEKGLMFVVHLPLGKSRRLAKIIFYFLPADLCIECKIDIWLIFATLKCGKCLVY